MLRIALLLLAAGGCTLQFDPSLIQRHGCIDVADNDACTDDAGTCHAGICCMGCWDGAQCVEGSEPAACGAAGAACQTCAAPTGQCAEGHCAVERRVVTLAGGVSVTAVVDGLGALWTFGANDATVRTLCHADGPPARLGGDGQWTSASESCCNEDTTLAIATDGSMWACGYNTDGQIGDGTTSPRDAIAIADNKAWKQVYAGARGSMGIKANGTLWGWGYDGMNRLGYDEARGNTFVPLQIGTASNWVSVSDRNTSGCGIDSASVLYCWGAGPIGRNSSALIAPVEPTGSGWREVSVSRAHACAIRTEGTLWCWGDNGEGELGIAGASNEALPAQVDTSTHWLHVAAGKSHTCATRTDGTLWCWGDNASGELGTGDTTPTTAPVQIGVDADWDKLTAAATHTCASKQNGLLYCWGNVIGVGTTTRPTPVVLAP